jgi:hypothetical protein
MEPMMTPLLTRHGSCQLRSDDFIMPPPPTSSSSRRRSRWPEEHLSVRNMVPTLTSR